VLNDTIDSQRQRESLPLHQITIGERVEDVSLRPQTHPLQQSQSLEDRLFITLVKGIERLRGLQVLPKAGHSPQKEV